MILKTDDAPEGRRWVCCVACQGTGKVLVDDAGATSRPDSASNGSDGIKRYPSPAFYH